MIVVLADEVVDEDEKTEGTWCHKPPPLLSHVFFRGGLALNKNIDHS